MIARSSGGRLQVTFTILGPPRTKKNSLRRIKRGARIFTVPSEAQEAWAESAVLQLRSQRHRSGVSPPLITAMNLRATVYRDAARGDLIGYLQAICDALQKAGVVENDRLIEAFDGSRQLVDRERPRVEIELTAL